jgi:hypothetical protein
MPDIRQTLTIDRQPDRTLPTCTSCLRPIVGRLIESVLNQDIVAGSSIKNILARPTDQNVIAIAAE